MAVLLLHAGAHLAVAKTVTPDWAYAYPGGTSTHCIDATDAGGDSRWTYIALPTGTAPAAGWPIWLELVTDNFGGPNETATCGSGRGGYSRAKPFGAFDNPRDTMKSCFENSTVDATGIFCSYELRKYCQAEEKQGKQKCEACAAAHMSDLRKACTQQEIDAVCTGKSPSPSPPHHRSNCDYDQEAGAMWNQRLKQFLVANGIAIVVINPHQEDSWDAGPWWWGTSIGGGDKPFLKTLFGQINKKQLGPLDSKNTIIRGWSGGAQMVSYLMQILAANSTEIDYLTLKGGVMLSGGSFMCYNDPQDPTLNPPPQPIGSCQGCTEGGPSHCDSSTDNKCDSCQPGVATYCQQCCPRNFTEPFYLDNPAARASHPPVFLAQTSKIDNHADLCACKNYYETIASYGGTAAAKSKLVLMPPDDEKCFCVGTPSEVTAAGSPYVSKCTADWGTSCTTMGGKDCCIGHTLGFAAMIEPALSWAMDVLA